MKLEDVEEVRQIGEKLQTIQALHFWLDDFSTRGFQTYSNGTIKMLELPHSTSRSLLEEIENECIKRLNELGVET
jgi:hypothetical protein